jgi:hypothetical protein
LEYCCLLRIFLIDESFIGQKKPSEMPDIEAFTSVNDPDAGFHYREKLPLLSLEEKVTLLSGISFTSTAGVARLGIPPLKVGDLEQQID